MKRISATEFARRLSDVLDAVEHRRESFEIVRNGEAVARVGPASISNGRTFIQFLRANTPDSEFAEDVRCVRSRLDDPDPWHA